MTKLYNQGIPSRTEEEHLALRASQDLRTHNASGKVCAHLPSVANDLHFAAYHNSCYDPKTGRNYSIDG